ncbi:hypothetical protein ABZ413_17215 [Nocardia rhamnosiphila]|uniref:hypothetical protein n=1 Tax=Nocardia rhamnosiphila TaxID=426716 RepID=UPI0033E6ECF0
MAVAAGAESDDPQTDHKDEPPFGEADSPVEDHAESDYFNEDDLPNQGLEGISVAPTPGRTLHEQRFTLAASLLVVVAGAALILLLASIFAPIDHLDSVRSAGSVVFGPLVTLLGTSFAWYYASRQSD